MPRYPEPHRHPKGQKKRAPAAKKPASQPSRHSAHATPRPQPKKQPVRAQSVRKPTIKKYPVKKAVVKQQPQRSYSSLLFYLWIALAFPELVLHLSTAKSSEMLLNSGLLLGAVFAVLPAAVVFVLGTSLSKGLNRALSVLYGGVCFLLCCSASILFAASFC